MTNKNIWFYLLIISGCSFQGASSLSKSGKSAISSLSNLTDSKKISLAGDLMIESLKEDLLTQGFTLTQVKNIVSSAKTEVSLSASLSIEATNLTLTAKSNNPYGIATSAVTKGALSNRLTDSFGDERIGFGLSDSSAVDYRLKKLKAVSGGSMKALGKLKEVMSPTTEELIDASAEVSAQAASSISKSGIPLELIGKATDIIAKSTLENIAAAGLSESTADVIKSLTKGTMTGIAQLFQNSDIANTAGDVSSSFITAISQVKFEESIVLNDLIGSVSEGAVASLNEMDHVEVSEMSSIVSQIQESSFEAIKENYSGEQAAEMFVAVSAGTVEGLNEVTMMDKESDTLSTIYQNTISATTSSISEDLGVPPEKFTTSIQKTVTDSGSTAAVEVFNDPCAKASKPSECSLDYCNAVTYTSSTGVLSAPIDFYSPGLAIAPAFQDQLALKSCRIPATKTACPASAQILGSTLSWSSTSSTIASCAPFYNFTPSSLPSEKLSFRLSSGDPSDYAVTVGSNLYLQINPTGVNSNVQTRVSFLRGCGGAIQEVIKKDWDTVTTVQPTIETGDTNQCLKLQVSVRTNDGIDQAGSPGKGDFYRIYPIYVSEVYDYVYMSPTNFISGSAFYGNLFYTLQERILEAGSSVSVEGISNQPDREMLFEMVSECNNTETILLSSNVYMPSVFKGNSDYATAWNFTVPNRQDSNCSTFLHTYLKNPTASMRGEKGEMLRRRQPITIVEPGKIPPRITKIVIGSTNLTAYEHPTRVLRAGKPVTVTAVGYDIANVDTAPGPGDLEYKFEKENLCNRTRITLRDWATSSSFNYTPTSLDVMNTSSSGNKTCVMLVGYVRDKDGLEYLASNSADYETRASAFVSDLLVPVTAPVSLDGFDDGNYFLSNEDITLDLSSIKARYPNMTEMKLYYGNLCYTYNPMQVSLDMYGSGSFSMDYVPFTNSYTIRLPSNLYGCMSDPERAVSLRVALRNSDGVYDMSFSSLDLVHDLEVPIPGLVRGKTRVELNYSVGQTGGGPSQYDSYGQIFKVGSSLNIAASTMGGYYGYVGQVEYRFEILHDDCAGNKFSELVSNWTSSSSVPDYTLMSYSSCSSLMISARDQDGLNIAGSPEKGDGFVKGHLNTAPSGYTPQTSINLNQINLVNGFKGQWDSIFAYPGSNLQFYLPATIMNESSGVAAAWMRAVVTNSCGQRPYGTYYDPMGAGTPVVGADSGWVTAGSLISVPIASNLLTGPMGYCYKLVISARSSTNPAFDMLGGSGVWYTYLEITPKAAVRPRIDLTFKKGGIPFDPALLALAYTDNLEISLTGTDPEPSQTLQYKIRIRDICTTFQELYNSSWSTQTEYSFAPGSIFTPSAHQSDLANYPYMRPCLEVTAFVKDDDSLEYYGVDQGDSQSLSSVGYSDGRLGLVVLPGAQKLFNNSPTLPVSLQPNVPFTTKFTGYRDAEGRPLRIYTYVQELCDDVHQRDVPLVQYVGGNPLPDAEGVLKLLTGDTVQMTLPSPISTCAGGTREVWLIQSIKEESLNSEIHTFNFRALWLD